MRLSTYLRPELVIGGLEASNRDEALRKIGSFLEEGGFVPSGDEVFQGLRAREESHTTALGEGVAVPHAVVPALEDVLLLVATTAEPLTFGPPESDPVDLLFTLISPPGREAEHIKLLARICRIVRHPGFLESLRNAAGGSDLHDAILAVDSQHV
jgi:mannitol/fructose-specific phosphotransferase system IIA component (Ntr-type)